MRSQRMRSRRSSWYRPRSKRRRGRHHLLRGEDAAVPDGLARPEDSEVLFWSRKSDASAKIVTVARPRQAHKRHTRKYAEGELGEDDCFYFRGPEQKLNLRAQNLATFLLLAEGVDDETWQHHLRAGDYSKWFRNSIKDDDLAEEVAAIETSKSLTPPQAEPMSPKACAAVTRRQLPPNKFILPSLVRPFVIAAGSKLGDTDREAGPYSAGDWQEMAGDAAFVVPGLSRYRPGRSSRNGYLLEHRGGISQKPRSSGSTLPAAPKTASRPV